MTKNITVIGENGNILYSTYPKRAKGLIKKGRARRISDTAVRLCAPNNETEENEMAINIYEVLDNQLSKMQEQLRNEAPEKSAPVRVQLLKTMEEMRRCESADKVTALVKEQLDAMSKALGTEEAPENAGEREKTRQKMLELMQSLVNGAPQRDSAPEEKPENV